METKVITLKRDYILDVLPDEDRKNRVSITWNVLNNSDMVKVIGYSNEEMENFKDMLTVGDGVLKNEVWFENFFNFLFNKDFKVTKETRKYAKHTLINKDAATIIFTSRGNDGHKALKSLLERTLGSKYLVKVLDGDETCNADAEAGARQTIKDFGTNAVFIASDMANRSFSVPEIENVVLLLDASSDSSIIQKVARGLTPWKLSKKCQCNVVDVRLKYNSDNLSKYLSELAKDSLDDNAEHSIEEIVDIINSTDKLVFNEYFTAGTDPFRVLSKDEIRIMLKSISYQRALSEKIVMNDLDSVKIPFQCGINDRLDMSDLIESNNIKGDSVKKVKANGSRVAKAKREQLDKDGRVKHLAFLLNNFKVFVSGLYEQDILKHEFEDNMSEDRKKSLETIFKIDMETMTQIANLLIKNGVSLDKELIG